MRLAVVLLAAVAAVAPAAPAGAAPHVAAPRPGVGVAVHRTAVDVRTYWTARRMAAAHPAESAVGGGVRFARPAVLDGYLRRLAPGRAASAAPGDGAEWAGA
ncbi:MAG TPA: hypothetical protein VEV65_04225, partial [Kineosporiaceae bacterium]|nr:hypothetical protein [Kineosporiaceae bacterium]